MIPRQTSSRTDRSTRNAFAQNNFAQNFAQYRRARTRAAKWVSLLALAGLLAIATLPSHPGQHAAAGEVGSVRFEQGDAAWHG